MGWVGGGGADELTVVGVSRGVHRKKGARRKVASVNDGLTSEMSGVRERGVGKCGK